MPSVAGGVAAVLVALAIYAGSRGLRYFDAALVGYATATVFLAFGVVYRYAVWVSSPPARRYLRRGWQAFFSWRNFRRLPTAVPRSVLGYLGFQTFLRARGRGRWLAHQLVFWGVVLATLITFPLTFGWLAFFSDTATGPAYTIYVLGFRTLSFDALSLLGWIIFHGLDIAAVLVLAGCGWFLWRRFRHREATTGERFGYDFFPLIGLVAISVTGLLLTFSSWLLEGRSYDFLAIAHMATVVLTLVFIPFGKFFHVIQRPASVGVEIYKRASLAKVGEFRGAGGDEPAAHWKATAAGERLVPTHCCFCGVQCGMYLRVMDGRVIGVEPRNHDINKLRLCPKGVSAYQQVHHPDRLLTPLLRDRRDGPLHPVSWEAAYD